TMLFLAISRTGKTELQQPPSSEELQVIRSTATRDMRSQGRQFGSHMLQRVGRTLRLRQSPSPGSPHGERLSLMGSLSPAKACFSSEPVAFRSMHSNLRSRWVRE